MIHLAEVRIFWYNHSMKIIAANWKMNKTPTETEEFFKQYMELVTPNKNKVMFFPPYISIHVAKKYANKCKFTLGAQNMAMKDAGAYTGAVSGTMLKDAGVKAVLIGHSERRQLYFENNDAFYNKKIKRAFHHGITPVYCIGETAEAREKGETNRVLMMQLCDALYDLEDAKGLIVAYEPVWAISGGDPSKPKPTPTREQIQDTHAFIRGMLKKLFPKTHIPILYGGSANEKNAQEIMSIDGVDGVLVGAASLVIEKFAAMVNHEYKGEQK